MISSRLCAIASVIALVACGGTTVVDPGSGGAGASGGQGGTGASGTGASGGTGGSTTSGPSGCSSHDQCPDEQVCLFATGQCVPSCGEFCDACGPGTVCDGCATSSCPACADCMAACRPIIAGECDENDPCLDGAEVCVFGVGVGQCHPECQPGGGCADPGLTCNDCGTGSCCGCEDCVPVCT